MINISHGDIIIQAMSLEKAFQFVTCLETEQTQQFGLRKMTIAIFLESREIRDNRSATRSATDGITPVVCVRGYSGCPFNAVPSMLRLLGASPYQTQSVQISKKVG